jgi:hypothetical protein
LSQAQNKNLFSSKEASSLQFISKAFHFIFGVAQFLTTLCEMEIGFLFHKEMWSCEIFNVILSRRNKLITKPHFTNDFIRKSN